nr:class I SAM-dependent methyltransferase [Brasilonema octagenarum]
MRNWSYRYQWFYDSISGLAALSVGGEPARCGGSPRCSDWRTRKGEGRLRQLALQGLTISKDTKVLDLCCGSGQVTQFLVKLSQNVTGLDASPLSLKRAQQNVPQAKYVEAFAEDMPFADHEFDVVHTSVALHEMEQQQLRQILQEVNRVLKPGGVFTLVDFHNPTNPLFVPGIWVFLLLFETHTAWQLLKTDLPALLTEIGFEVGEPKLYAGGSLQVIQAKK